jgi:hypothetical protein
VTNQGYVNISLSVLDYVAQIVVCGPGKEFTMSFGLNTTT